MLLLEAILTSEGAETPWLKGNGGKMVGGRRSLFMRLVLGCEVSALQAFRHFSAGDERALRDLGEDEVKTTVRRVIRLWL